jgi:hypothetical protein
MTGSDPYKSVTSDQRGSLLRTSRSTCRPAARSKSMMGLREAAASSQVSSEASIDSSKDKSARSLSVIVWLPLYISLYSLSDCCICSVSLETPGKKASSNLWLTSAALIPTSCRFLLMLRLPSLVPPPPFMTRSRRSNRCWVATNTSVNRIPRATKDRLHPFMSTTRGERDVALFRYNS